MAFQLHLRAHHPHQLAAMEFFAHQHFVSQRNALPAFDQADFAILQLAHAYEQASRWFQRCPSPLLGGSNLLKN
ncbi:hypothetical protein D3C76_1569830 [compost metagenome]